MSTADKSDRFQLSEEQFAELATNDPDVKLLKVGVKGIGVVVIKPPSRGDFRRFSKKLGKGSDDPDTLEELARCCVVWPSLDDLEKEIEKRRKYGAWVGLGNQAGKLSGLITEEIEGN